MLFCIESKLHKLGERERDTDKCILFIVRLGSRERKREKEREKKETLLIKLMLYCLESGFHKLGFHGFIRHPSAGYPATTRNKDKNQGKFIYRTGYPATTINKDKNRVKINL